MDTLPTEIAHHIFWFLPRSSLYLCLFVNQLWHDCSQAIFYEKVPVQSSYKLNALLTTLTKTHKGDGVLGICVKLLTIMIDRCDLATSQLSILLLLCPNVEEIYIRIPFTLDYSDPLFPLDAAMALTSCNKLHTLRCIGLKPLTAVESTGYNFPNLTCLELFINKITVETLEELAIFCPNLDELRLKGTVQRPIADAQLLNPIKSSLSLSTSHWQISILHGLHTWLSDIQN